MIKILFVCHGMLDNQCGRNSHLCEQNVANHTLRKPIYYISTTILGISLLQYNFDLKNVANRGISRHLQTNVKRNVCLLSDYFQYIYSIFVQWCDYMRY